MVAVVALRIAFFLTCVICRRTYTLDEPCVSIDFLDIFRMSRSNFHPFFEQATVQEPRQSRRALKRSRQGPNSLGSTSIAGHFLNTGGATDVQVGATAVGAPDRVRPGSLNTHGGSANKFSYRQQVRKRALQRACQRAAENPLGGTMYRGRWRTLQQLGAVPTQPEQVFDFSGACNRTRTTRSTTSARVNVCTINVGGFDAATFDTFFHWLDGSDADIIGVQEIHFGLGKESKEWSTGKWHVITSVSKRFAGVAFFVRSSKWSLEQIRFREVMQGRVLHMRLQQDQRSLDLVNVYQFARPSSGSHETAKMMAPRAELWKSLHGLLGTLPRRNPLILMGDFNCNVKTSLGLAGAMALSPQHAHSDQSDLQAIMQSFHLCALNTWTGPPSTQVTCKGPNYGVQIDFIFTRAVHADHTARRCAPNTFLDFSPWRGGSRHYMLQASVPTFPGWRKPTGAVSNKFDRQALITSVREQDEKCTALQQAFASELLREPLLSPQQANTFLLQQCCMLYPPVKVAKRQAWQTFEVTHALQEVHRLRSVLQLQPVHALLSSRRTGQLFRAFKEAVSLIKKCRQLRQACKQARKVKLHNLMQGLEAASLRNDFYSLYKQIRSLAPKSQRRRVQVRDKDGNVLGPSAEHDSIVEHFRQLFKDSTHSARRLESACYISLGLGSFAKGFSRLKYDTAVPPGCAPTAAWKAVSDQAIPWLQSCAMHALRTSLNIPTIWSDSWLTLIPKPHRMSRLPGDLRPLGIQEVTGKLVIASIRDQLRDLVHDLTAQYPQYAYMCGRGTDAAISRVSEHCRLIREANKSGRLSLYERASGVQKQSKSGGGQLKLDLSTAFDLLPRHQLLESLQWSGASRDLISVILAWHDQCRYHVIHGGRESLIHMQKGVRQGCPLAPYLFLIFSTHILKQLADRIGMQRVLACVTLFADDTHVKWAFQNPDSFKLLLADVQLIFTLFEANGMVANPSKSEFICVSRDPSIKRMIGSRLSKIGGKQYIDLGAPGKPRLVKFVLEFEYLGIIASYKDFEFRSLQHRLSAADSNYGRLKRILHSTKYIGARRRLIVYNACVRSSATYGLLAVGLTQVMLEKLCKFEIRHIRAIAKAPRHLYHEASTDLLNRLKQNTPVHFLLKIAKSKIGKIDLPNEFRSSLCLSIDTLERYVAGQGPQRAHCSQQVPCPTCGLFFESVPSMRLHHARKHGKALGLQRHEYAELSKKLKMADHMLGGMPICKHCGVKFSRPQSLKTHLLKTCPVFTPDMTTPVPSKRQPQSASAQHEAQEQANTDAQPVTDMTPPVSLWPQVLAAWRTDWKLVLSEMLVTERLKSHCIFCGAFFVKGGLKSHLRRSHAAEYKFQSSAEAVCRSSGKCTFSPCEGCGLVLKSGSLRTHPARCEVLFQIRLAFEVHNANHGGPGAYDD